MKLGKRTRTRFNIVETEDIDTYISKGYKPICENIQPDNCDKCEYEDWGNYYVQIWNQEDTSLENN